MMSRRILITGINYAPEETGIALQTTGLAEGLAELGWDVTVLTGVPHYPAWKPGPIPRPSPDGPVHVIRRQHFVPPRQSVGLRAAYECSWIASCLPTLMRSRQVDVVLGITPSLGGAAGASVAATRLRVPYVLLIQDLMGRAARQSKFRNGESVAALIDRAEVFFARRAYCVAVIAEGFRSHLQARGVPSCHIHLVRNPARIGDSTRCRQHVRRSLGWDDCEFIVLHAGNMGLKQGLENVLAAAGQAHPEDRVRFVLQGDGNQREYLERVASDLDLKNVTFTPLVPSEDLPDVLAAADLLLLNQRREVRDMSLPGKLANYFGVGRPVLAAVAQDSEAGREVTMSSGGIVVEPERPDALLQAVKDLASQPALCSELGARGREFADHYLRPEATVQQMDTLLQSAVKRSQ